MEANIYSGEANYKNLEFWEKIFSMNPLFYVFKTCFFMIVKMDGNANKDWWSPIPNFPISSIQ